MRTRHAGQIRSVILFARYVMKMATEGSVGLDYALYRYSVWLMVSTSLSAQAAVIYMNRLEKRYGKTVSLSEVVRHW